VLRIAPFLIEIGLLIYCLIDAIQTPDAEVRNLPKVGWILLILIIPVIGSVAWLVAGRPRRGSARQVSWPSTQTAGFPEYERPRSVLGPDDDPEFLREMKRGNDEQEQLLNRWEEDLRRREEQLRPTSDPAADQPRDDGPDDAPKPSAP
jgi:Phospholipase_D-nuclease N-terminal